MRARHKSMTGRADRVLRQIEAHEGVDRVAIGRSTGKAHGRGDGFVRMQGEVPAGFRILVYGSRGVTNVVVYCKADNRDKVRELIEDLD